jgi:hypothetical protein
MIAVENREVREARSEKETYALLIRIFTGMFKALNAWANSCTEARELKSSFMRTTRPLADF